MTPGARVAAAIDVLDSILSGQPAEQALTNWARRSRFAGSSDRAAVRDHVFDALRRRGSGAHCGGAPSGRGVMLGLLAQDGADIGALFSGQGHAPAPLSPDERAAARPGPVDPRQDFPEWLLPELQRSLGADSDTVLAAMRHRAPVFVRVNAGRATTEQAAAVLASEGVIAETVAGAPHALRVTAGSRGLVRSRAYLDGLVEPQDLSSQMVTDAVPLPGGKATVLDYCAGGGGKALALAARGAAVTAHDADPVRMRDLPHRAARAGAEIRVCTTLDAAARFDTVLVDAPCSGSGAWRRSPDAKWRLTEKRLNDLVSLQSAILATAARHVAPGGCLAYVTCSYLNCENRDHAARFSRETGWKLQLDRQLTPLNASDGFYLAVWSAP